MQQSGCDLTISHHPAYIWEILFMYRYFLGIFLSVLVSSCAREDVKPVQENGIFINEIAAKGGQDWLEIYNDLDQPESLQGYLIYDDSFNKYELPDLTIAGKGFVILNCDGTGTGLNPNFKLSSLGETVYLESPDGNLIDQVSFPAMSGSQSFARFPDGSSEILLTGEPTKGMTNGQGQFPTLRNVSRDPLIPSVSNTVKISIEVLDPKGIKSVKLYYRFNNNPYQFVLMNLTAGLYVASIPETGSNGQLDYYIEALNTIDLVARQPSSAPATSYFYLLNSDPLPILFINEFLASNTSCCADPEGNTAEFDDWLEIFNPGNTAIDLAGMYLSDSLANPFKFRIATGQSSRTTVPPGGYLVIYADEQISQGILHANFKLNQLGEELGLFYKDGRRIDFRIFGTQNPDQSEGRRPDGSEIWGKMTPTRGLSNQ